MLASLDQESEILAQILALKNDPVGFVHYAYPWGREGTQFAGFKGPRRWQIEELERIGEHVRAQEAAFAAGTDLSVYRGGFSSGRGPGKSALFGMAAHWHTSTRIGAATIVTANTEGQLRTKTFPEFNVWFGAAINSHWFVPEALKITPAQWLVDTVKRLPQEGGLGIDPKYWYVAGQMWSEDDPNAFAGAHNPYGLLLLFDEAAGIHSTIWDVAEGFFTEINPYRFWLAASQTRSRSGRFFEILNDPKQGLGWHTRTLSTRGMEGIDQALIRQQIEKYGEDSDFVRVEIDGLPPRTAEDQFIDWERVRAAQQNVVMHDDGEPLILGVDPAPRGKTAWRFRQGRNARDCCGRDTHGLLEGSDNVSIANRVLQLDWQYKPDAIVVDFGMGTGVIDILKRRKTHGRLHEAKFGGACDKDSEWATPGTELWARMKEWLPGGMIEPDDGETGSLSDQMTNRGWRWSGKEDGKKILETKEAMRKRGVASPDDVDALACTFHVNPPRRDHVRIQGGGPRLCDGVEADQYAEG